MYPLVLFKNAKHLFEHMGRAHWFLSKNPSLSDFQSLNDGIKNCKLTCEKCPRNYFTKLFYPIIAQFWVLCLKSPQPATLFLMNSQGDYYIASSTDFSANDHAISKMSGWPKLQQNPLRTTLYNTEWLSQVWILCFSLSLIHSDLLEVQISW